MWSQFKGRNVSELRICRKNIFGKFFAVLNRNMYTHIYIYIYVCVCVCVCVCVDLGNLGYLYVPKINDLLLWGNQCVFYPGEVERVSTVLAYHLSLIFLYQV